MQAANHQRVVRGDDELPLRGTNVLLQQIEEVVGPHRVEVRVGLVQQVERLVVLSEQQETENGQELLLTFAQLDELDSVSYTHLVDTRCQSRPSTNRSVSPTSWTRSSHEWTPAANAWTVCPPSSNVSANPSSLPLHQGS